MAHINRRFIDKHWFVFIIRGVLAGIFGFLLLFGGLTDLDSAIAMISLLLLTMGVVDSAGALYNASKKRGWINSLVDAIIDIAAALSLLFLAQGDLVATVIIIAVYVFVSGLVDIFHGFISTVDPTDRFIRIIAGVLGCVLGAVILNAGSFELMTFIRFFGVYMIIVGTTSMIYGVHNRSQDKEDKVARKEARRKIPKKSGGKGGKK